MNSCVIWDGVLWCKYSQQDRQHQQVRGYQAHHGLPEVPLNHDLQQGRFLPTEDKILFMGGRLQLVSFIHLDLMSIMLVYCMYNTAGKEQIIQIIFALLLWTCQLQLHQSMTIKTEL